MSTHAESDLFQPVELGPYTLANRIVMAPLTRSRANKDDAPYEMHADYYGQRATAGLIISEATQISRQGKGYCLYARHPQRSPGSGLEEGDRRRSRQGRPHLPSALACRPHLAPRPSGERRASGCSQRDQA